MHSRRTLRNGNTCHNVPNPLLQDSNASVRSLIPNSFRLKLQNLPQLNCGQINSLLPLPQPNNAQDALRVMKQASQWQQQCVNGSLKSDLIPPENLEEQFYDEDEQKQQIVLRKKEQERPEIEDSIYSGLFEKQLHDFIMNPHPANYDFDYQYFLPSYPTPLQKFESAQNITIHRLDL